MEEREAQEGSFRKYMARTRRNVYVKIRLQELDHASYILKGDNCHRNKRNIKQGKGVRVEPHLEGGI